MLVVEIGHDENIHTMENSKHYKSGLPSARVVVIKHLPAHPWEGVPSTSWFGVHYGLWRKMMTTCGVWLALCDAMMEVESSLTVAFSVLLFLYVNHRGWARLEKDCPCAAFLLSLDHVAVSTMPRAQPSAQAL